jgi:hypothetical protein
VKKTMDTRKPPPPPTTTKKKKSVSGPACLLACLPGSPLIRPSVSLRVALGPSDRDGAVSCVDCSPLVGGCDGWSRVMWR